MSQVFLKIMMAVGICCIIVGLLLTTGEFSLFKEELPEDVFQGQVSDSFDSYAALSFEQLKEMNTDFIGKLNVGGIIRECVVKSADNEDYLNLNLEGRAYGEGTVFMDFRNQLEDQNLILYGTTVFSDMTLRFGPLSLLQQQDNYRKNKDIVFEFGYETKTYEICAVMHFDINEVSTDYAKTNYTEEEMDIYLDYIDAHNLIEPAEKLNKNDRFLTLQSDVVDHPEVKLVVVAKEVNR